MDPRIQRTWDTVLPAMLAVLAARGFARFTMEAVAEAAGVSHRRRMTASPFSAAGIPLVRQVLEPESTTGEPR